MADNKSSSPYIKREKIIPKIVHGRFQRLRTLAVWILLGIFYILPFINWHGRQAVLFHIAERRFYIFDINIWPQDFILLTFTLFGLALILFFVTSIAGRLWCGYACPQTVYTEVFMGISQLVEGDRAKQMRLDKQPWNAEKWRKRGLTYLLWILFALFTGLGFVGYFTPIRQLYIDFFTFNAGVGPTFWVLFYGGFMFLQAGFFREQFCKFLCPYARFQGAMFDRHTLIIAYDEKRGEPRHKLNREDKKHPERLGYCVDCSVCVQVCPTGIDIRDGLQIGCIACAACIDGCDEVMDRIGAPRGLIRYTSDYGIEHGAAKILRPKTIAYSVFIIIALSIFLYMLFNLNAVDLNIVRDRTLLGRNIPGNQVENVYIVKILNKTEKARAFTLSVEGLDNAYIQEDLGNIQVEPAAVYDSIIHVVAPREGLADSTDLRFTVTAIDDPSVSHSRKTVFRKPMR